MSKMVYTLTVTLPVREVQNRVAVEFPECNSDADELVAIRSILRDYGDGGPVMLGHEVTA